MNSCILVVDDDQAIVNAIAILLEREGYQVLRAYDGRQALEMVAEEQVEAFCQSCGKQFGEGAALAPANLIDSRRFEVKTGEATISLAPERSYLVEDRVIDGRRYLLIPVDETLEVNGLPVE